MSRLRPDTAVADVRAEICAPGNFFASAEAAAGRRTHHPDATLVLIARDFHVTREAAIELGWAATRVSPRSRPCQVLAEPGALTGTERRGDGVEDAVGLFGRAGVQDRAHDGGAGARREEREHPA